MHTEETLRSQHGAVVPESHKSEARLNLVHADSRDRDSGRQGALSRTLDTGDRCHSAVDVL